MPTLRTLVLGSILLAGALAASDPTQRAEEASDLRETRLQLVFPATVKFADPGTIEVTFALPKETQKLLDIRSGWAGKQSRGKRKFDQEDEEDLPVKGDVNSDKNSITFEFDGEPEAAGKKLWLHWKVEFAEEGKTNYAEFPALAACYGRFDLSKYDPKLPPLEYYVFEASRGPDATPYRAHELELGR